MNKGFNSPIKKNICFFDIQMDKAINFFIPNEYKFIDKYSKLIYNKKKEYEDADYNNIRKKYNSADKNVKKPLKRIIKVIKKDQVINPYTKSIISKDVNIILNQEEEKNNDKFSYNSFNYISNSKYHNNFVYDSNIIKKLPIRDCYIKPFGIKNIGHSCYINSFLQILLRTPFFVKNLKIVNKTKNILLIKLLIDLSDVQQKAQIIKKIKSIMSEVDETYDSYEQNDSQDFGINLINYLITLLKGENSFDDEEDNDNKNIKENIPLLYMEKYKKYNFEKYLNKYFKKENENFVEKMFQFHESKLELETNEKEKKIYNAKRINFETSINMELSFAKGKYFVLKDLLSKKYPEFHNFFKEFINVHHEMINWESIKDAIYKMYKSFMDSFFSDNVEKNNINIDGDEKKIDINKTFCFRRIASLPKILILSINRAFLGKNLNNSYLSFDETLDLKDYIDDDICKEKSTTYTLFAINECKGIIKERGHCYSYIKISNKWFKFDDHIYYEERPNFNSKYVIGLYYIKNNFYL